MFVSTCVNDNKSSLIWLEFNLVCVCVCAANKCQLLVYGFVVLWPINTKCVAQMVNVSCSWWFALQRFQCTKTIASSSFHFHLLECVCVCQMRAASFRENVSPCLSLSFSLWHFYLCWMGLWIMMQPKISIHLHIRTYARTLARINHFSQQRLKFICECACVRCRIRGWFEIESEWNMDVFAMIACYGGDVRDARWWTVVWVGT